MKEVRTGPVTNDKSTCQALNHPLLGEKWQRPLTSYIQEALCGGLPCQILAVLRAHGVRLMRQSVLHVLRELLRRSAKGRAM